MGPYRMSRLPDVGKYLFLYIFLSFALPPLVKQDLLNIEPLQML